MRLDLSFFTPGENPLLDYSLRAGVDRGALIPLMLVICCLLGYAAYTDFFRGWIIPNGTNAAVAAVSLAAAPLVVDDLGTHLLWAGVAAVIIVVLGLVGVFMMGDTKLYLALSLLLGRGALVLMVFSWVLVLLYAPFYIVKARRERRERKAAGRSGTPCPLGPAIAAAFPLTLFIAGAPAGDAAALFGVQVLALGVSLLFARKVLPALERAEARAAS